MRRPCLTSLVLSLFWHLLTKGERQDRDVVTFVIVVFLPWWVVVVVAVDVVSCESRGHFQTLSFYLSGL